MMQIIVVKDVRPAPITPIWRDLFSLLMKLGFIALAAVILFTFFFGLLRYQDPYMNPAIKDGDLVVFYRITSYGYLPQDVVAIEYEGNTHVRRVVATGGDIVDIADGDLKVNGAIQQEPAIHHKTEQYLEGVEFPLTVPEGHVFVLGDVRDNATDSRVYGCVRIEDTKGKVMTVLRRRNI